MKTRRETRAQSADAVQALEAEVARLGAELDAVRAELAEEQDYSASLRRLVDRAKRRLAEAESGDLTEGVDLTFGRQVTPAVEVEPTQGRGRRSLRGRKGKGRRKGAERGSDGNIYVFDDQDATGIAFDEFFANPDPDLDKVRGFLLD
ncbi:MAG: hypothetical protein AAF547_03025 [Actinomycetota bacterium]